MTLISSADIGMPGNSHVPTMDRSNVGIVHLILTWIDEHVERNREENRRERTVT